MSSSSTLPASPAEQVFDVLTPVAPYDFEGALGYLRRSPSAILERVDPAAGSYRRAIAIDGRDVLVGLRSVGTTGQPRLLLEVYGEGLGEEAMPAVGRLVRRIFSLDDDPASFLAVASRDPVLYRLTQRFPRVRPVLVADPFEALLWAIIGQQVNVAFARKQKEALVELCGRRLRAQGEEHWLLPHAVDIAALDPAALTARQFSRQKAAYVIGVAQAAVSGALDLEGLRHHPAEEALAALMGHRGVGRWTAEYVLMRGLGFPDAMPAADLGLRAIIGRAYGLGRTATEQEVRARAEAWLGWRGWAAFYWWMALQVGKGQVVETPAPVA